MPNVGSVKIDRLRGAPDLSERLARVKNGPSFWSGNMGKIDDFEEALRVIKIEENKYIGAHPLRYPLAGARGVYGGHMVAQVLLVGIESCPANFIPHSFHSYFVRAGSAKVPMEYEVTKLQDDENFCKRSIVVVQENKTRLTCIISCVKKGKVSQFENQRPIPKIKVKYPDPERLTKITHTDYVKNSYSPEFVDHKLVPEEDGQLPSERWITLYSGLEQPTQFRDPKFHYVGLADLSDSAILTTMARVLHRPWNATESLAEEFDESRDARILMETSLNVMHIFHYTAMSLDHHIYFHNSDYDQFDMVKDWLCLSYQMRRLSNNRTLVRGHLFNSNGRCIATVVQEGLTLVTDAISNSDPRL